MDTTLKQRIVGIFVLIALLGFCLTVLLRNTKTIQPHVAKIDTHPAMLQTLPLASTSAPVPEPTSIKPAGPADTAPADKSALAPLSPKSLLAGIKPAPVTIVLPVPAANTNTVKPAAEKTDMPVPDAAVSAVSPPKTNTVETALPPAAVVPSEIPATAQPPVSLKTKNADMPASPKPASHKRHIVSTPSSGSALAGQKDLVIQVGTFSIAGNAQTLVDKLRARGFSAQAQKIKTSKGEMVRVIVGKKGLNYAQAEALRQELAKSMTLKGIIISHAKG
jgi:cell division septation protein DedD